MTFDILISKSIGRWMKEKSFTANTHLGRHMNYIKQCLANKQILRYKYTQDICS